MFNNIYQNKTVLVTGHTGFKGSWLSIWLKEFFAPRSGILYRTAERPQQLHCGLDLRIKLLTYTEIFVRSMYCQRPSANTSQSSSFHLAAQPILRLSYEEPKLTFDTNLGGTINGLEAVRSSPRRQSPYQRNQR